MMPLPYGDIGFTGRRQNADSVLAFATNFVRDRLADVGPHVPLAFEGPGRGGERLVHDNREAHGPLHIVGELRPRLAEEALLELLDHRFVVGTDPETCRAARVVSHTQRTAGNPTKSIGGYQ